MQVKIVSLRKGAVRRMQVYLTLLGDIVARNVVPVNGKTGNENIDDSRARESEQHLTFAWPLSVVNSRNKRNVCNGKEVNADRAPSDDMKGLSSCEANVNTGAAVASDRAAAFVTDVANMAIRWGHKES
ncbi:unnamed protein product [Soboliphyme baturini]|uniref:Uncharacterized protein n=1 Tax=Soboliphyme baturini TaxID=241478 RepID=A0A183J2U6_9BILA|nr:unnamed protein product [Soboliphyme baturini]